MSAERHFVNFVSLSADRRVALKPGAGESRISAHDLIVEEA